jgi:two-component system, OmpR family, phosphate regulon sensor histidine kinase PhoR
MPPVRRPRFPTPTTLKRAWQHTAWRLALVVLCTLLLGLLIGQPWPLLCAGLLGVLVWHYAQLHRLLGRLNRRERLEAPEGAGVFSELARVLYLRQRENRERKRRLLGTLRAFRQAAAALPDAVVVLNRREQRIEWFNESTEHLLGLSYPKDIGNRFSNLVRSRGHRLAGIRCGRALDRRAGHRRRGPAPVDAPARLHAGRTAADRARHQQAAAPGAGAAGFRGECLA